MKRGVVEKNHLCLFFIVKILELVNNKDNYGVDLVFLICGFRIQAA